MHLMGPPGQGTRQPRKDSQNNVEKIPMAAAASSNLQRLLEQGQEPKQNFLPGPGLIEPGVTPRKGLGSEAVSKLWPEEAHANQRLKSRGAMGRLMDDRSRSRTGLGKSDCPGACPGKASVLSGR